jgi:hypothetical protein
LAFELVAEDLLEVPEDLLDEHVPLDSEFAEETFL